MANVIVPVGGLATACLVIEYANADTNLTIYDEPILAHSVDDATNAETPVIPGAMPPPPAAPDPNSKPTWVNIFTAPGNILVVYPDRWRGNLQQFFDWLSQGGKLLRGDGIAAPAVAAQWREWAYNNPTKVWTAPLPPTATAAILTGGTIADPVALLATLSAITDAGFAITINGTAREIGPVDFTGAASLGAVAALITTALASAATCALATDHFTITTTSTGTTATIGYATAPAAGTDVSATLQLTAATGATLAQGTEGAD